MLKSFMTNLESLEERLCQSTFAGVGGDEPTGMLLPAVQKVREAAARMVVDQDAGGHILPYKTANEAGYILPYKAGDETQEARRPYFKPGKELPVVLDEEPSAVRIGKLLGVNFGGEPESAGKYSWAYLVRPPRAGDEGVVEETSVRYRGFALIDRTHVEAVDAYFKPGKELFVDPSDPSLEQTRQLTLIQDM